MAPKLPHPLVFGGKTGRDPLDEPSCIIALREGHDSFPFPVEISFSPLDESPGTRSGAS